MMYLMRWDLDRRQKILEKISVSTQHKEESDEMNLLDISKENQLKQDIRKPLKQK